VAVSWYGVEMVWWWIKGEFRVHHEKVRWAVAMTCRIDIQQIWSIQREVLNVKGHGTRMKNSLQPFVGYCCRGCGSSGEKNRRVVVSVNRYPTAHSLETLLTLVLEL